MGKTKAQTNLTWTFAFKANDRFPIVADRIFDTLVEAQEYVDDVKPGASAIVGAIISVNNDTENNGIYRISEIPTAENKNKGKLEKIGGQTASDVAELQGQVKSLEDTVNGSKEKPNEGLVDKVATIQGEGEGSIKKAVSDLIGKKQSPEEVTSADDTIEGAKKLATENKNAIDAYTVNNKSFADAKGNIVLDGKDVALTGYTAKEKASGNDLIATDKINDAFKKLENRADAVVEKIELTGDVTGGEVSVNGNKFTVETKIAENKVTTTELATDAVHTENIFEGAVATEKIAGEAVTTAKIANLNVTTEKLAGDAVTNEKLADNAVQTENILDKAVTDAKIDTVDGHKVTKLTGYSKPESYSALTATDSLNDALGKLEAAHVADETAHKAITVSIEGTSGDITAEEATITDDNKVVLTATIDADAVTTDKIADANVTDAKIADDITAKKSQVKTYTATKEKANGDVAQGDDVETAIAKVETKVDAEVSAADVQTVKLGGELSGSATAKSAKAAITVEAKINNDAVVTEKILNGAVTTDKLHADAVTNAKLADNAVQTENIVDGHVTAGKLATDSVITEKILNAAVTDEKIDTVSATKAKLSDGYTSTTYSAIAGKESVESAIAKLEGGHKAQSEKLKDILDTIDGGTHFIGVTETSIKNGDKADSKIITDIHKDPGKQPASGDFVIYDVKEFIASGNPLKWVELGDTSLELGEINKIKNGETIVPKATDSAYASKIGTSGVQTPIGDATTPVYVAEDGTVTSGTKLGASAYHEDNYFASAAQGEKADSAIQDVTADETYLKATNVSKDTHKRLISANVGTMAEEGLDTGKLADAKDVKTYVDNTASNLTIEAVGDDLVGASVTGKKKVVVATTQKTKDAVVAAETSVQTIVAGDYIGVEADDVTNKNKVTLTPSISTDIAAIGETEKKLADAKAVKTYVDKKATDLAITAEGDTDYIDASITGKKNVVVKATKKTTDAISAAEKSVQTITAGKYIGVTENGEVNAKAVTLAPNVSTDISKNTTADNNLADAHAVKTYVDAVKVTATGSTLVNASVDTDKTGRAITLTDSTKLTSAVEAAEKSVQTIGAGEYIEVKADNITNKNAVTLTPNVASVTDLKGDVAISNKFADAEAVRTVANDIKTTFYNLTVNGVDTTVNFENKTASVEIKDNNIKISKVPTDSDVKENSTIDTVLDNIYAKLKSVDGAKVNDVNGTTNEVVVTNNAQNAQIKVVSLKKEAKTKETVEAGHIEITSGEQGLFAQMYYDGDDSEA